MEAEISANRQFSKKTPPKRSLQKSFLNIQELPRNMKCSATKPNVGGDPCPVRTGRENRGEYLPSNTFFQNGIRR